MPAVPGDKIKETDREGMTDAGRSRMQTEREGESGKPASPILYPFKFGR